MEYLPGWSAAAEPFSLTLLLSNYPGILVIAAKCLGSWTMIECCNTQTQAEVLEIAFIQKPWLADIKMQARVVAGLVV